MYLGKQPFRSLTCWRRHWNLPTSRRWIVLVSSVSFFVTAILVIAHHEAIIEYSKETWKWNVQEGERRREESVRLPFAWKYLDSQIKETDFVTDDGVVHQLDPDGPRWHESRLGKKVLILDVDSRLDTEEGSLLNPNPLTYKNMIPRTGGYLNHMLYAQLHGYDYRLVRPPNYPDRHGTWVKVPVIQEALKSYDIVVFLDADCIFRYLHLPLEWLMSHWNITEETMLAAPIDVEQRSTHDIRGNLFLNTGFIIAQQSERTQEMFTRWEDCPSDKEWPECSNWNKKWAHEQAAFGNFVRYDYNTSGWIQPLPCNEANGSPLPRGNCRGVFVRHYWGSKAHTIWELFEQVTPATVTSLHERFHQNIDEYFLDINHLTYPFKEGDVVLRKNKY